MPNMKNGPLIEAQLEEELDRFATWLMNEDTSDRRRRRRKVRRPSTAHSYRERMGQLLRRAQAIDADAVHLQAAFLAWMEERTQYGGLPAASTVRNSFYAVKAWCQWKGLPLDKKTALDDFDVPPNSPDNARGEDSVIDPETVRLFLARLARQGDRRNYAICRVLLRAGPRRRVIAMSKVRDFDHGERCITIRDEASKGGLTGAFIMDAVTADAIQDYLETRWDEGKDPEAPLFHSYATRGHMHPDSVTHLVVTLTSRLLDPAHRKSPHQLHHTFITFAANGVEGEPMPIAQLQRHVHHTRPTTTLRYVHAVGDPKAAYDRSMGMG